eukprot:6229608-Amphidinium_carterae.1
MHLRAMAKALWCDVDRGLFPLPEIAKENLCKEQRPSNKVMCRLRKRWRRQADANAIVVCLNEMAGFGPAMAVPFTEARKVGIQKIFEAVARLHRLPEPTEVSVNEILSCEAGYGHEGGETCAVAPYESGKVSLPDSTTGSPLTKDVIDPKGRCYLEGYEEFMLRGDAEVGWAREKMMQTKLYMDVILKRSTSKYAEFAIDLEKRGVVTWEVSASSICTPFFVWKKDKVKRRLILDCRRTNFLFRDPPKMRIASGAKMAEIVLGHHQELWVAKSDIRDFFYNLRLDGGLKKYFAMPAVRISDLKMKYVKGQLPIPKQLLDLECDGWTEVFPTMNVVPMGFLWAMFLGQRVHSHQVLTSSGLQGDCLMEEHGPMPHMINGGIYLLPYVDNLNVFGTCQREVDAVLCRCVRGLRNVGFPVHEVEWACQYSTVLGYEIDGRLGVIRPKKEKLAAVIAAWVWLSTGPIVRGKTLEKILGHSMPFLLLCRPLLSCLSAHRERFVQLWHSARKEARTMACMLIFCEKQLRNVWSGEVTVSDASLTGFAVCGCTKPMQEVMEVGQHKEKA